MREELSSEFVGAGVTRGWLVVGNPWAVSCAALLRMLAAHGPLSGEPVGCAAGHRGRCRRGNLRQPTSHNGQPSARNHAFTRRDAGRQDGFLAAGTVACMADL